MTREILVKRVPGGLLNHEASYVVLCDGHRSTHCLAPTESAAYANAMRAANELLAEISELEEAAIRQDVHPHVFG